MACIAPATCVLTQVTGPRAIKCEFTYLGDSHKGFDVSLQKLLPDGVNYELVDSARLEANEREVIFDKRFLGVGDTYKAAVQTRCDSCTVSADLESAPVVIV